MVDVLDPLEKILSAAVALQKLVEIFRSKDKWFETCSKYLSTVVETMSKYKKSHNPKKKIPDACFLLQTELESFKFVLEKEQQRSSFSSFFHGSTLVKEAQNCMHGIEKQIHNFNLALSVDNQIENNENFQKMQSLCIDVPSLKKSFVYAPAGEMWVQNFYQDEQVSWTTFIIAFQKYILASEKLELNDEQLENILSCLDENHDKLIRYQKWDKFYGEIWSKPTREEILKLKKNPLIQTQCKIKVPPVVLKMTQINIGAEKYNYQLAHEFYVSEQKVVYVNYEGKEITHIKKWEKEALTIGRIKPGIYIPDIYFHPKISSVEEKQFQIVLKKRLTCNGFFIINLASGSPTMFRLEKIPYIVSKGMIFDLAGTLIEVTEIIPQPDENVDEDDPDYFYVNMNNKLLEDPNEAKTRKVKVGARSKKTLEPQEEESKDSSHRTKKKDKPISPMITLQIIQVKENEKQFSFQMKDNEKIIRFGSEKGNEVFIDGIEPLQMLLKWDASCKHWVAFSEIEDKGEKSSAYLYLIEAAEFKAQALNPGKISVKLRDGMKIAFGGNELAVIIQ